MLIFEDLHWADDGQLDFIDHLLEWSRDVPLLVISLARPELLERRPGWGTSARSFNAIGLEPLTDTNMRDLLRGLVPEMPEAAIEQVLARADGIPLYAVEMVRMLIAEGALEGLPDGTFRPTRDLGELALPDTLRALVASRLDGLEPRDRQLVQDATILGQTFDHRALAHITDRDEDEVEARLRALVRRELLEVSVDPRSPERGQFGFVQSVIREVAYDTLSRHDRRSRHLAAARYLETSDDEELAAVLATHYLAAFKASDEGPEADGLRIQARLTLRAAADRASMLGSPEQALVHLQAALEIAPEVGEQAELHAQAALASQAAARLDEALQHARSALELFEHGEQRRAALDAAVTLATIQIDAGYLEDAKVALQAAVERAAADEDADLRAALLAVLARAHMRLDESKEAVAAADAALALAEPRNLVRVVAEALVNKGSAMARLHRLHEPTLLLRGGAELAEAAGDLDLQLRAEMNLGVTLGSHDLELALETVGGVLEVARRLGIRKYVEWTTALIPLSTIERGQGWDEAIAMVEEGLADFDSDFARQLFLGDLYWYQAMRGEDSTATAAEMRRVEEGSDVDPFIRFDHVAGYELLLDGRDREAVTTFRSVIDALGMGAEEGVWGLTVAALKARDLDAAREAEQRLRVETSAGNAADAARAYAAAAVAALESRPDEAVAGIVQAVRLFREAGWQFMVAVAQTIALDALPGRPEFAGWAEEAAARFEHLRAVPWSRLLAASLERSPGDETKTAVQALEV